MCECNPKISIVKTSADGKTNTETCKVCGSTRTLPATFEGIQDMFINKVNPSVIDQKPKGNRYQNLIKRMAKIERMTVQSEF